jgi:hypothetical protein
VGGHTATHTARSMVIPAHLLFTTLMWCCNGVFAGVRSNTAMDSITHDAGSIAMQSVMCLQPHSVPAS